MTAAEAVVLAHFGFIAFVVGGGFLVLRWPRLAWAHVPAAVWGAAVQFGDWVCPLTHLENALRGDATVFGAGDGFIERTLMPLIYPDLLREGVLTPTVRIVIGVAVVALNVGVYAIAVRRWRQRALGDAH